MGPVECPYCRAVNELPSTAEPAAGDLSICSTCKYVAAFDGERWQVPAEPLAGRRLSALTALASIAGSAVLSKKLGDE